MNQASPISGSLLGIPYAKSRKIRHLSYYCDSKANYTKKQQLRQSVEAILKEGGWEASIDKYMCFTVLSFQDRTEHRNNKIETHLDQVSWKHCRPTIEIIKVLAGCNGFEMEIFSH